jgi:hypothetical protein
LKTFHRLAPGKRCAQERKGGVISNNIRKGGDKLTFEYT